MTLSISASVVSEHKPRHVKHQHNAQNIVYYSAVINRQKLQFLRDNCTALISLKYSLPVLSSKSNLGRTSDS